MLMTYLLKAGVLNRFYAMDLFFWQFGEAYGPDSSQNNVLKCIKLHVKYRKGNKYTKIQLLKYFQIFVIYMCFFINIK